MSEFDACKVVALSVAATLIDATGTARSVAAVIAAGFLGPKGYIADAFGVETNARSNVATEAGKFKTNVEKVFTAGDMHRGQSLVVWAIREGRDAAADVDEYLMGYAGLK